MKRWAPLATLLVLGGFARADDECRQDTFYMVGEITSDSAGYLLDWLKTAKEPRIIIDSRGGSMEPSVALAGAIGARGDVRCLVRGMAASGAFAALQACRWREMEQGAWLMTHEPRAFVPGAMDRVRARRFWEALEALSAEWNALCRGRLRMTAADYESKVMGKDWIIGPGEALRVGAIDRVAQ